MLKKRNVKKRKTLKISNISVLWDSEENRADCGEYA